MTKFDAAFLSCRVLALWVLVLAVNCLSNLPGALSLAEMPSVKAASFAVYAVIIVLLPLLTFAGVSVTLWTGARWLATRMTNAPSADSDPMTRGTVQQIAFTIIGVFLLAQAVPEAARQGVSHLLAPSELQQGTYAAFVGKNWELLLRFLLGVWLVTGAPALSRWLGGIRQPVPHPN